MRAVLRPAKKRSGQAITLLTYFRAMCCDILMIHPRQLGTKPVPVLYAPQQLWAAELGLFKVDLGCGTPVCTCRQE